MANEGKNLMTRTFKTTSGLMTVAAALSLVIGGAMAQQAQQPQQQRPAAQPQRPAGGGQQPPAAAPAAPQPQAPARTVVQVKPEPSQADWLKVCGKDQANNTEICYTTRDFVSDQGQPVLALAVYDVKSQQPQRVVRALVPLGLLLRPGVRFGVDQGQPQPGAYAICLPNGCFAENTAITPAFVDSMKKGTTLNLSVQNQAGAEVVFAVPLEGFGKAFDGPPIDPKVLEEQQKKAIEEQRVVEEQQRKLREELDKKARETQGGAAPAPGAAPAANAPKP